MKVRKDHPLLMDTRKCKTCGETKPLNKYNFRKKFHYKKVNKVKTNIKLIGFAKECMDCVSIANKPKFAEWYLKNKDRIASREKNHRLEMKKKAVEYKGGRCVDCVKQGRDGVFSECAYAFHHANPTEKEYDPSKLMKRKKWKSIKEEIDKCVLLCLNCHSIRHYTGKL